MPKSSITASNCSRPALTYRPVAGDRLHCPSLPARRVPARSSCCSSYLTAVFANWSRRYDPLRPTPRASLAPPAPRTGSAPISWGATSQPHHLRRAHFAGRRRSARPCSAAFWSAIPVGLASGYIGGWVDLIVQRLIEIMQSLPLLVMALVIAASLGPSLRNTIIAIAIPLIPGVARVIRSNVLSLRELPFVEAARAIGMGEFRIAVRHVLPNTLAPLIVLATAQLGSTILTEASLSFLGLGVPEPYPSWGRMLSESAAEYVRTAPWLVIFPGLPSALSCSAPTCWATRCATCSIRGSD